MRYCDRPFDSVEEMNETLIQNWNRKVRANDEVYVLGDFTMSPKYRTASGFLEQMKGTIHLIIGNHDLYIKDKDRDGLKRFESHEKYMEVQDVFIQGTGKKQRLVFLCHYPMVSWNRSHYGSIHLFGHVHNSPIGYRAQNSYNARTDVWNYEPVTLNEIIREHGYVPG
jgi:calcineurin-like phosphoesterase family protein